MLKNIIFDVGGILFDDGKKNIEKVLNNKNFDLIYNTAYGKGYSECLLGKKSVEEYIDSMKNLKDFQSIKYILSKENLEKAYPLIEKNYTYIKELKKLGYKLYLLTNITENSYNHIKNIIDINVFNGGIYSYQVHLMKPDPKIYQLIIEKYNLNKNETVFFDDREENVKAANKIGIKAFVFNSIEDVKNNII